MSRELKNRHEGVKLEKSGRNLSWDGRRTNSRKKSRIRAIGDKSGIVNEKKEDFEGVRSTKEVIAKEA